jgi:1-acyl-sn-glycerol-3-phosphate acyltransferase
LIDREDRRSQLRTFKEGIAWLKKGVPLMAFPEGKRSKDGRLMEFKGGLFSMAVKTQVPIVPITISNAHAVMPSYGLLPVQRGAGKLRVHVHEAIDTQGKTEAELGELVRAAFLSQLPLDQHPLAVVVNEKVDNPASSSPPPTIAVYTENVASTLQQLNGRVSPQKPDTEENVR